MMNDYKTYLTTICEKAETVMENLVHGNFTDHSIKHSKRVNNRVDELLRELGQTENLLSDEEDFILRAAVYLHDVGMQYTKYQAIQDSIFLKKSYEENYLKNLSKDEQLALVREHHHELSYEMIMDTHGRPQIGLANVDKPFLVEYIALVAKGHRVVDLTEPEYDTVGEIRLRLLAAILRLADEFDIDADRINLDILESPNLPLESKLHWWLHHYVRKLHIKHGQIKMYYGVPREAYQEYERVIKILVSGPIWKKHQDLAEILWDNGIRTMYARSDVRLSDAVKPMPPALFAHAKKQAMNKFISEDELIGCLGEGEVEISEISPYYYTAAGLPLKFSWNFGAEHETYEITIFDLDEGPILNEKVSEEGYWHYPEYAPPLEIGKKYVWRIEASGGEEQFGVFWLVEDEKFLQVQEHSEMKSDDDILCIAQTYFHLGLYENAIAKYTSLIAKSQGSLESIEAYRGLARVYVRMYDGLREMDLGDALNNVADKLLQKALTIMDIIHDISTNS